MSNFDLAKGAEDERNRRLSNKAPQVGDFQDQRTLWGGDQARAEDKRVRDAKINDLHTFTQKKFGRNASEAEIAAHLGEK